MYGSDKPDLRISLKLTELTDVMKSEQFEVFRAAANSPKGRVAAFVYPWWCGDISQRKLMITHVLWLSTGQRV